jgi:hypothetical protein
MNKKPYRKDIYGIRREIEEIDYAGYHAYEAYLEWAKFQKKYPYNAQLLVELFGERDAMDVFRYMLVLPELKARALVERLRLTLVSKSKLKNMSDY